MRPGSLHSYLKLVQEWENRVKQGPEPSMQEQNEFVQLVGQEFCKLPPDYNTIMNLETETSFLHTFAAAFDSFGVFCRGAFAIMIWPVRLLRRISQRLQR